MRPPSLLLVSALNRQQIVRRHVENETEALRGFEIWRMLAALPATIGMRLDPERKRE